MTTSLASVLPEAVRHTDTVEFSFREKVELVKVTVTAVKETSIHSHSSSYILLWNLSRWGNWDHQK